MRYIITLALALCAALPVFGGETKSKNADSKTACVFAAIDTVKRNDIALYIQNGKKFSSAARKTDGCIRAFFLQNVFHKDKFLRYVEFANIAEAKKFAAKQIADKAVANSETFFFTVQTDASKDTKLIIAVDFDNIAADRVAEFLKISKPLRDGTNTEKDTISYEIYSDPTNPAKFFLFELYKNRDAHAFHAKQSHFIEWYKKCKELKFGRKGKFLDVK